ncbi:potassium transporter KefB [Flavobacterium sp.]|uniref:potassium transporter KefB n=1 Tax=Flavobacterium sp. TaxID=239 RepID=UPI001207053F|nr:potassium transporter KefB [Flavobacterium sp.]RZJ72966.1 MAG: potassium transporter KefB [Flavobacterium sp.]
MSQIQNQKPFAINPRKFAFTALIGAAIALAVICVFVFNVTNPNPEWPQNWRVRPLCLTPMAGAAGGGFFYLMKNLRTQSDTTKILALCIGSIGFLFALWIGIVLGLDGTLWD